MVPDTNQAKLCYCAALAAAWCPLPSLVCSAASHICKIIWHERRDSAAASHVAERKRIDKKCVRPGTHLLGFLSDDLVGFGQLDPAALAVAALPTATASLNLSVGIGTRCTSGRQMKNAGPDIPSFLSPHFTRTYHDCGTSCTTASATAWSSLQHLAGPHAACRAGPGAGRRDSVWALWRRAPSYPARSGRSLGRARSTRGPDTCKTFPPTICAFWGGVRRIYSRGGGGECGARSRDAPSPGRSLRLYGVSHT